MISKVISGKSFSSLCAYLCKDQARGTILKSEGVRDYDYRLMAMDFEQQRELNPAVKSPVLHMILSYYPGEKIEDDLMTRIAEEYLRELGIQNTQAAIIKHSDRKHPHTHIVVNRINNDGKTIKDNWIGLRAKKTAQSLTLKYGLIQAEKKTPELTQLERRSEYEIIRYEIYQHILDLLPVCQSLDELKKELAKLHVEMIYKFKGVTMEIQGLSFKKGEFKFKGSEIDRAFSYKNLRKSLSPTDQKYPQQKLSKKMDPVQTETLEKRMEKTTEQMGWLLENLTRPEKQEENTPSELLRKKRGPGH